MADHHACVAFHRIGARRTEDRLGGGTDETVDQGYRLVHARRRNLRFELSGLCVVDEMQNPNGESPCQIGQEIQEGAERLPDRDGLLRPAAGGGCEHLTGFRRHCQLHRIHGDVAHLRHQLRQRRAVAAQWSGGRTDEYGCCQLLVGDLGHGQEVHGSKRADHAGRKDIHRAATGTAGHGDPVAKRQVGKQIGGGLVVVVGGQ